MMWVQMSLKGICLFIHVVCAVWPFSLRDSVQGKERGKFKHATLVCSPPPPKLFPPYFSHRVSHCQPSFVNVTERSKWTTCWVSERATLLRASFSRNAKLACGCTVYVVQICIQHPLHLHYHVACNECDWLPRLRCSRLLLR